jgi:hypothetical protein
LSQKKNFGRRGRARTGFEATQSLRPAVFFRLGIAEGGE